MSLSNHNLFEMINANPGTGEIGTWLGLLLAYGSIWAVIAILSLLWRRADGHERRDLVLLGVAALMALAASELWGMLFPQPRPIALHMGVQLSPFPLGGAGMPSDEAAALMAMGLAAFTTRGLATLGFPLLTLGLLAGWGLVYTGEHFPYDIVASIPVAAVCAWLARAFGMHMPLPLRRRLKLGDDVAARGP